MGFLTNDAKPSFDMCRLIKPVTGILTNKAPTTMAPNLCTKHGASAFGGAFGDVQVIIIRRNIITIIIIMIIIIMIVIIVVLL